MFKVSRVYLAVLWFRAVLLLPVLALVLAPSVVYAESYTEPTQNTDGSPLDDLASCTVVVTDYTGTTGSQVFSATSQSGGGVVTYDPDAILPSGRRDRTAYGICTDTGGEESPQSNVVNLPFRSDGLAPAAPVMAQE